VKARTGSTKWGEVVANRARNPIVFRDWLSCAFGCALSCVLSVVLRGQALGTRGRM